MPNTTKNRPLAGISVLITRPERQSEGLAKRLESLGASVVLHPAIRISILPDRARVEACLSRLEQFAMVGFLSKNAAIAFAAALSSLEHPNAIPPIAAIGVGTQSSLQEAGYSVQFLPEQANSESMAKALVHRYRIKRSSKPILILRADRGSDVLAKALMDEGVPFEELAIYRNEDVARADPDVLQQLSSGKLDWLTVTSSAIAKNVSRLFGQAIGDTKIVSISPKTSKAARAAGLTITAEAEEYNEDGLIAAILKYETGRTNP